jgi:hypothetical protein
MGDGWVLGGIGGFGRRLRDHAVAPRVRPQYGDWKGEAADHDGRLHGGEVRWVAGAEEGEKGEEGEEDDGGEGAGRDLYISGLHIIIFQWGESIRLVILCHGVLIKLK